MAKYNRIRVVLAEQDKNNKWLAEAIGVQQVTVSRWTSNKVQPSLPMLFKVAEALNIDARDLILSKAE